jgi:hypothetical protein
VWTEFTGISDLPHREHREEFLLLYRVKAAKQSPIALCGNGAKTSM